jgi:deoxyribonuclease V
MRSLHDWAVSLPEARALQERLRRRVVAEDRLGQVRRVAGVDVSYDRGSPVLYAAVVVLDARTAEPIEATGVRARASFPYVPGYLSFRELPGTSRFASCPRRSRPSRSSNTAPIS